ncbi:LYR motif-containing protein 2 isoform X2 [Orussus abietinus]|uniref:LYR motif-containing protein 2 isoform X2 n=1 Tax=Orussus abietinus TaxID=222816 RepID=UPI00062588DE|nr:LYR motif-containing protein 2 isoform X2 [Orussus abietinus]
MSCKVPPSTMTLKQFMVHQEVLKLYRNIMKTIRKVPNEADRKYLTDWAKADFRANKSVTDEL